MDYWRPIRDRWDELTRVVLHPGDTARVDYRMKRWLNPFALSELAIALTGMRGAGKTTLHKALRHRLPIGESAKRGESPDKERDRFVLETPVGRKRVKLVVVPGQKDSPPGRRTISEVFMGSSAPTGVLHSTSCGYSTIWDPNTQRAALDLVPAGAPALPAVQRIQNYNLQHELDDFLQTKDLLQQAWQYTTKPIWLVLAVSKVDLYRTQSALDDAGRYYIPAADPAKDSEFSRELRGLVDFVGQGRFVHKDGGGQPVIRIAVLPVCAYLEAYSATAVNAQAPSHGDLDLMSALLAKVMNTIGEFCGVEPR
ncbi:GTPase domain-containing protein [Kutzneria chonburiensis]|uniref:G domain-containing protein n=1 Tax=Kutzneria chonburiensis TaxID=1483604 RepID=A0ABV6MQ41_9PSEU|nr:hypothetical protein [Kutzneria chonburiensis]